MKDSYTNMELLRFTVIGSVDNGKSTLIGRILFDSNAIPDDQLEAVKKTSERKGINFIDLSLLTDGLSDEREQGITIDAAYRYFATSKRKFIISDTPGHLQYTRNMFTGASMANAAIILIDARKGINEQNIRHSYIASLLQIQHLIVCVNKMDLVEFSEELFNKISVEFQAFASKLDIQDIEFIPISALSGDNVVKRSEKMDWYQGGTLMYKLENVHIGSDHNHLDARFPVQTVIRFNTLEYPDYRGYAGRIAGGIFKTGDDVIVLPSGKSSKIKNIQLDGKDILTAFAPMSVSVTLEDDLDVGRGSMIANPNNSPQLLLEVDALFCWLNEKPLNTSTKYLVQHTTNISKCTVKEIIYKLDISTLQRNSDDKSIQLNDIFRAKIKTSRPIMADTYRKNRITGSMILIDPVTCETLAAGMIVQANKVL
jgi:sulfate adenylyltransferase subunit 1